MKKTPLKILCGNANRDLAKKVAQHLGLELAKTEIKRFSDGEIFVRVEENVRGADVFILQSTCSPANDHLMEILLIADALRRASAARITAVIPYYGYARQDRKDVPRTLISPRVVAHHLEAVGVNRVFSLDLHAPQIQGFFKVPVDHLFAASVLLKTMRERVSNLEDLVLVSPDAGSVERTRAFAKRLDCSIAIVDKRRSAPGKVAEVNIIGEVTGKECVMIDDLVDTAGTICEVARVLIDQKGARMVWGVATHPVLSGPAIQRIQDSPLVRLIVTDTIPLSERAKMTNKIEVLSVADLLADGIRRIHDEDSVSELFV